MIGPFPLLPHLTFCVGTKALGVVRIEGELSELARTNVGVETALHVLTPPERESQGQGIGWKWCLAGSAVRGCAWGRALSSSAGSLVLTGGFRQVAWAVDVSGEGILQGYLRVSQMWSILKLRRKVWMLPVTVPLPGDSRSSPWEGTAIP